MAKFAPIEHEKREVQKRGAGKKTEGAQFSKKVANGRRERCTRTILREKKSGTVKKRKSAAHLERRKKKAREVLHPPIRGDED